MFINEDPNQKRRFTEFSLKESRGYQKETSLTHDGVHEEDLALGNVLGELGVDDLGLVRVVVRVNEDLADADRAAAVAQALLHGLAAAHDAHAAVALLEAQALVRAADRRHHRARRVRQLVQALLDHQPDLREKLRSVSDRDAVRRQRWLGSFAHQRGRRTHQAVGVEFEIPPRSIPEKTQVWINLIVGINTLRICMKRKFLWQQ